jgi:hypothetical protein
MKNVPLWRVEQSVNAAVTGIFHLRNEVAARLPRIFSRVPL